MIDLKEPFKHHKLFIGLTSIVILILGLIIGSSLSEKLGVDLDVVNTGLTFTNTILLLIIGGLILDTRGVIHLFDNKKGKNK